MKKNLIINMYENNNLLFKENLIGTLENNILEYTNETDAFLIDLEKEIFRKENIDSILEIKKELALITIKEFNKTFEINLDKYIFENQNQKISILYHLESSNLIKIEIEMRNNNA